MRDWIDDAVVALVVAVFATLAIIVAGCASGSQQGQVGTRDVLPNAKWVSPDVEADNAQIGGTRAGAGAQVVEVHTNGLTTVLVALGATALVGLVLGGLLYRSRPPEKRSTIGT